MNWRASLATLKSDGLKARALRGSAFTILIFGAQNALRLISNLILTRLLFPEAFGLMAIVFTVQVGIGMMADLGIRVSIIQDEDGDKPRFLDTAFTIQILRGVVIAVLILLSAHPIAAFYGHEILADILIYTGGGALLNGLVSTKLAESERRLRLGRVAFLQILARVIGLIATILLAYVLGTVWALVYGYLIGEAAVTLLSHLILSGHANRLTFDRTYARRIIHFGAYILLSSLAGFLIAQGDRTVLGKVASLEELALYNIGYFLAAVPLLLGRSLIDRVVFPLYTQRPPWQGAANQQNIFRIRRLITLGGFSGLAFMALIGMPLVVFLYDPRYEGAGAFVTLIALALMPAMIIASYAAMPLADGNSKRFATITVGAASVQMLSMLALGGWIGVAGVILGLGLAPILYYPVLLWLLGPYRKGWDPLHDAGFAAAMAVFAGLEIWRGTLAAFLN